MSAILEALASIATTAMSMLGEVATAVVGSPILLLFVILGLVGLGVGFFQRLTR